MNQNLTLAVTLSRPPLTFHYNGELPTTGVVGIYGRNGAGKTTLVELLAAALAGQPVPGAEGEIHWPGRAVWSAAGQRQAHCIGAAVIGGTGSLFPHLTVRDNLLLAPKAHQPLPAATRLYRGAAAVLASALAGGRFAPKPHRPLAPREPKLFAELSDLLAIGGLLSRYPHQLSAGEYQRCQWARALLLRPAVLFLDEPFAHLDWPSRVALLPFLAELSARFAVPVYWISHDPHALAKGAGHIAVIAQHQLTGVFLPHQFTARLPEF